LAQSDYPVQKLKRKRPKTHWIWYIGAISASLVVGVSITYAMHQVKQASGSKGSNKTTILANNHSSTITPVKWITKQPANQIKAEPVPSTESKAPIYSSAVTNTNQSFVSISENKLEQKSKPTTKPKKLSTTQTKKTAKPQHTSKPSQVKETKPNHPKETPPTKNPDPVVTNPDPVVSTPETPSKPSRPKGPVIRIVDRLTNTVHYLLTGKTKN
jgi:hypothetical protein